jgi:hypothetical protein
MVFKIPNNEFIIAAMKSIIGIMNSKWTKNEFIVVIIETKMAIMISKFQIMNS